MKLLEIILLATDFSKSSDNALKSAITLAKIFQSKIILIHVLPNDIKNEKARTLLNKAAIAQLDIIYHKIKSEGVKTEKPILEHGNYFENIIETADSINANMILIGAGDKLKNDIFQLGTTAEKVIRKSHKPVFVVKNDKPLNIKRILCPIDFSDESKRALKNAITMTRRFKAELIIFSVYQVAYLDSIRHKIDLDILIENLRLSRTKELNTFLDDFDLTDLSWEKEIQSGDPATQILEAIRRYKSDLIIMGTSGKTGFSKLIMGSVTEKVIREVPSSFITLKSEDFINLKLITRIRDIEKHYDAANQLLKDGFLQESINEFEICLTINDMHIPSLNGAAKVYEKLGNTHDSEKYKNMAKEVLDRIWDKKIEAEIRKHYKL